MGQIRSYKLLHKHIRYDISTLPHNHFSSNWKIEKLNNWKLQRGPPHGFSLRDRAGGDRGLNCAVSDAPTLDTLILNWVTRRRWKSVNPWKLLGHRPSHFLRWRTPAPIRLKSIIIGNSVEFIKQNLSKFHAIPTRDIIGQRNRRRSSQNCIQVGSWKVVPVSM